MLRCDAAGDAVLVRTDRALYRSGDAVELDVLATFREGVAFVDFVRAGRTHLTAALRMENGRGHLRQEIPLDLFGATEIHAYIVRADGTIARDTRLVYIQPAEELAIRIATDQETYRPGAEARIRFEVLGRDGGGVAAAIGVIIVDEAVYALQEMQPGLEKVFFTLEQELARPKFQIKPGGFSVSALITAPEEEGAVARRGEVAQILFAAAEPEPQPAARASVNQVAERYRAVHEQADRLTWAVSSWVQSGKPFAEVSGGEAHLLPDLLDRIANDPEFRRIWNYAQLIESPLGGRWTIEDLMVVRPELSVRNLAKLADAQKIRRFMLAVQQRALEQDLVFFDTASGEWVHDPDQWELFLRAGQIPESDRRDAFGNPWTWARLAQAEPFFGAANIARLTRWLRAREIYRRILDYVRQHEDAFVRGDRGELRYRADLLERLGLSAGVRCDIMRPWTLESLQADYPQFAPEQMADAADRARLQEVWRAWVRTVQRVPPERLLVHRDGALRFADGVLDVLRREGGLPPAAAQSVRGGALDLNRLVGNLRPGDWFTAAAIGAQFRQVGRLLCERLHRAEEVEITDEALARLCEEDEQVRAWAAVPWSGRVQVQSLPQGQRNYFPHACRLLRTKQLFIPGGLLDMNYADYTSREIEGWAVFEPPSLPVDDQLVGASWELEALEFAGESRRFRGAGVRAPGARQMERLQELAAASALDAGGPADKGEDQPSAAVAPPRIREYFPETLYWNPALITDEHGVAEIALPMADSITTWRLTASANARDGRLGSVASGIRVFQPFFVDIDFPVALTQNDVVRVPIAVYNYLPERQEVRLVARPEDGFELVGDEAVKTVALEPQEVRAVYFRVRARAIGRRTFLVEAYGSRMSDAIRRSVEVRPDGKMFEQVWNGPLAEGAVVAHAPQFPAEAIEGSCRCFFKLYPGVFAQAVDGIEGMLTTPHG
jgi:hypothetical protein